MRYVLAPATVALAMPPLPSCVVATSDVALPVPLLGLALTLPAPLSGAGLPAVDVAAIAPATDRDPRVAERAQEDPEAAQLDVLEPPGTGRALGPGAESARSPGDGFRPILVRWEARQVATPDSRASACTEVGGR